MIGKERPRDKELLSSQIIREEALTDYLGNKKIFTRSAARSPVLESGVVKHGSG